MSQDDDDWSAFQQHRQSLLQQGASQLAEFDKTILLLSTGALSLSIVFVEKFADTEPIEPALLALAWAFFTGSILLNLFSYVTSWHDTNHEIRFMDKNVQGDWRQPHENFPRQLTISLNFFAGLVFVIGVIILFRFAYLNMV